MQNRLRHSGYGLRTALTVASSFSWSSYWNRLLASPNSDIVQWNSIDVVATTGEYLTAHGSGDAVIVKYKGERITGNALISQIQVHNKTITNLVKVVFYVWRLNISSTYDIVYSENITTKLTSGDGVKTITLETPISLKEGDFVGMYWQASDGGNINAATAAAANSIRYKITLTLTDPYAWDAEAGIAFKTQIHCKGTAPMIIGIGDSMMESYPSHTSMVDITRTTVDITKSWLYKLNALDSRFSYQDCGIGNTTTTQIESVFNRDVVLKKPKLVVINGGVNDIDAAVSKATFLAKWESMLDACVTNNIIPIVWKIMPCNNLDNTQMQTRDEWNTDLVTLFNTYSIKGKQIIDWDSILGVNRVGGDADNLWNINPTYANGDGTHLNEDGQALLASTVLALFT